MEQQNYICIKCNGDSYDESKISTTGAGLSKFLNIQANKFIAISCTGCGYTELFKGKKSGAYENILDMFTN
jgi:predicted nucleic-acid-binding Zn-ribbon protein|tara:strand:+ start:236 stop:448 length:213 start_codon:yes stop_codon:yes gene_type:complete